MTHLLSLLSGSTDKIVTNLNTKFNSKMSKLPQSADFSTQTYIPTLPTFPDIDVCAPLALPIFMGTGSVHQIQHSQEQAPYQTHT